MEMGQSGQSQKINSNTDENTTVGGGCRKIDQDDRKRKQSMEQEDLMLQHPPMKLFKNNEISPCKVHVARLNLPANDSPNSSTFSPEPSRPYVFNRPIMNDCDDYGHSSGVARCLFNDPPITSPCSVRVSRMVAQESGNTDETEQNVTSEQPNKDLISIIEDSENSSLKSEEGSDSGLGSDAVDSMRGATSNEASGSRIGQEDADRRKRRQRRVRFHAVTVYYFPRAQGFCCIPSQGGSTLGMASRHVSTRRLSVARHCAERRHRLATKAARRSVGVPSGVLPDPFDEDEVTSDQDEDDCEDEDSDDDSCEDESESEDEESEDNCAEAEQESLIPFTFSLRPRSNATNCDLTSDTNLIKEPSEQQNTETLEESKSCDGHQELTNLKTNSRSNNYAIDEKNSSETSSEDILTEDDDEQDLSCGGTTVVLVPVPARKRRALLRAAGVKKIDPKERDDCRAVRASREVCGCDCRGFCDPETCACSRAGVKCQVDRVGFPCGCHKDGCANTAGRAEFNPHRVRTHFMHTLMRLALEERHVGLNNRGGVMNSHQQQHSGYRLHNQALEPTQESFRNPAINHSGYPDLFHSYGEGYGYEGYMYSSYEEPMASAASTHLSYTNSVCRNDQELVQTSLSSELATQNDNTDTVVNPTEDPSINREENFAEIIKNTMVDTVSA